MERATRKSETVDATSDSEKFDAVMQIFLSVSKVELRKREAEFQSSLPVSRAKVMRLPTIWQTARSKRVSSSSSLR